MATTATAPPPDDLITRSQAAKILGVSVDTIQRRIESRSLEAFDVRAPGSQQPTWRVSRSAVEAHRRSTLTEHELIDEAVARLVALAPRLDDEKKAGVIAALGGRS